mmetsp:Transcript_81206/g.188631  ORF Transcript_81206/g.188631 Transcript_81206/m.188631 type:complete len:220 (+) Transcript_81206:78-737(+)
MAFADAAALGTRSEAQLGLTAKSRVLHVLRASWMDGVPLPEGVETPAPPAGLFFGVLGSPPAAPGFRGLSLTSQMLGKGRFCGVSGCLRRTGAARSARSSARLGARGPRFLWVMRSMSEIPVLGSPPDWPLGWVLRTPADVLVDPDVVGISCLHLKPEFAEPDVFLTLPVEEGIPRRRLRVGLGSFRTSSTTLERRGGMKENRLPTECNCARSRSFWLQ